MAKEKTFKITTDLLTEKDIKKIQTKVKQKAMDMLEGKLIDEVYYHADKHVAGISKKVVKECKEEFEKVAKEKLLEYAESVRFTVEVETW